jgi:hypothetical protein
MDEQVKEHHPGDIKRESADARAGRIIADELHRLGWNVADLRLRLKTHPDKPHVAQRLRAETILPLKWIAARLSLGTTACIRLQQLRTLRPSSV